MHDDRDKVYGLLGMLDHIGPGLGNLIIPDYRTPVETVYMQTMLALLKRSGSPEPLRFRCAKREHSRYDLPSWCDDWSGLSDCVTQDFRSLYRHTPIHHAADSQTFDYKYNCFSRALFVSGTIVDEVAAVSLPNLDGGDEKIVLTDRIAFIGGATPYENLLRIILGNHDLDAQVVPKASREYIETTISGLSNIKTGDLKHLSLMSDQPPRVASMIDDALNRKALFRTKLGMFGMSCHHAAVGDKVCLIDGGGLPFLLREVSLTDKQMWQKELYGWNDRVFELIGGECYIHGLANGEMGHANAEKKEKICLL